MKQKTTIMLAITIIIALMTITTIFINTYAVAEKEELQEVINSILSDSDFNEYLGDKGIKEEELKEVLYSDYFANYVEYELTQIPEDDVIASWDILDWHIQKLENFINYLFTGDKDYRANNNNNNYSNYNDHNYNRYNNMMPPPPPPPNTNWNNGWGQYPPNNWNNGYNNNNGINNNSNNNCSGNSCNCNCDNCMNCLNK